MLHFEFSSHVSMLDFLQWNPHNGHKQSKKRCNLWSINIACVSKYQIGDTDKWEAKDEIFGNIIDYKEIEFQTLLRGEVARSAHDDSTLER